MNSGENPNAGRILGLDVGSRRMGIAVSDPLGITAQGLTTLHRRNRRQDFQELRRVLRDYEVREIVVGNPLRMSGASSTQSEKMVEFVSQLRHSFSLPVHLWDERLSTAEAHRLLDETAMSDRRRTQVIDKMAAVLILQSFLDARSARASHHGNTEEIG